MKAYQFTKKDRSRWRFFYDTNIQYWTVMEIDLEGNQLSREADYYRNKEQLKAALGFDFKTVV